MTPFSTVGLTCALLVTKLQGEDKNSHVGHLPALWNPVNNTILGIRDTNLHTKSTQCNDPASHGHHGADSR